LLKGKVVFVLNPKKRKNTKISSNQFRENFMSVRYKDY
jgi:hypothetical protein